MNLPAGRIGILGGTFDPIHAGHVAAAHAACRALALDRVVFVPSRNPPHRPTPPAASAFHRFAMVSLAVDPHRQFLASDIELLLDGPSYTSVTLERMHEAGYRASQLFFITGADAFAEVATWHDYPAVLDLANFVVISRPGRSLTVLQDRLPDLVDRIRQDTDKPREDVDGARCAVFLVNAETPDVSSTRVRERAATGELLGGLVAPEVERHIRKHRLYGS